MAFYPAPSINYFGTTLNGAIDNSVTTITLNSVTGLATTGGVLVIDRENSSGTATPNAREVISYTGISGNDLTGVTRAFDNSTARSHGNNALVEAVFTVGMWNDLRNAVATAFNTSGTGVSVSTATVATLLTASSALTSNLTVANQMTALRALVSTLTVTGTANFSGASVLGVPATFNFSWMVPGSLASQVDVAGRLIVPSAADGKFLHAYLGQPASVASVGVFLMKNGAVYGTVHILGGQTYASSASIATPALAAGDLLSVNIGSNASLAQDLWLGLRAQ